MSPDAVTIVVSTGIGISVIAGVLSGMCYILVHGFKRKSIEEEAREWYCFVCGIYLRSSRPGGTKAVLCIQCEERVCRSRCSKRAKRGWICYKCLKKASWLEDSYNNLDSKYKRKREKNQLKIDIVNATKMNTSTIHTQGKDHIREFIESLVSRTIGENVDDIFKINHHQQYNKLVSKYYQDLCSAINTLRTTLNTSVNDPSFVVQSPTIAYSSLKEILENLKKDASLMSVSNCDFGCSAFDHKEQTYEELLAATILNKVINKHQINTSANSTEDNDFPRLSNTLLETENRNDFHGKENVYNQWYNGLETNFKFKSSSDDNILTEPYCTSAQYCDGMPLTIGKQAEGFYPQITEGGIDEIMDNPEDDVYFYDDSSNWFMKRRLSDTSYSTIPVPMVVPNPLSVSKVLIGETEIDDTSDLSDDELQIITKPIIEDSGDEVSTDSGIKDEGSDKFFTCHQRIGSNVNRRNMEEVCLKSLHEKARCKLGSSKKNFCFKRTLLKAIPMKQSGSSSCTKQSSSYVDKKKIPLHEVNMPNPIDQLEATYTYSSLPRSLYISKNSSKNFVKNPLLNFPES